MSRIKGLEPHETSLGTRFVYGLIRRYLGKTVGSNRLVEPVKVAAHSPRVLKLFGIMEMGQEGTRTVDPALKHIAAMKADMMIGCPF